MKIKLTVNNEQLLVNLVDNSSTRALVKKLKKGPKTVKMKDYANMEKVGMFGKLPTNDEQINAQPGDLILYMGVSIVLYYEPNSWNFTKLGSVENKTQAQLKEILGTDTVNITFENA